MGGLAAHLGARLDDHELFGSEVSLGGDASYGLGGGLACESQRGRGLQGADAVSAVLRLRQHRAAARTEHSATISAWSMARAGKARHFALTVFRRDSEDLIGFASCFGVTSPTCATRPFGYYDNTDRARCAGSGGRGRSGHRRRAALVGDLFLSSTPRTAQAATTSPAGRGHSATVFADYTAPFGLSLGADVRLVGDSFDDTANTTRLDGYALVDLRASFEVLDGLELFGRVENVFDEDYQTAAGYNSARRGAFVGLRGRM